MSLLHHVGYAQFGRAGLEPPSRRRELGGVGVGAPQPAAAAAAALMLGVVGRGKRGMVVAAVVALVKAAVVHHSQLLGRRRPLQDHRKADLEMLHGSSMADKDSV